MHRKPKELTPEPVGPAPKPRPLTPEPVGLPPDPKEEPVGPAPKPRPLTPELRDEICRRFAETHNASATGRATGVSDRRVRRVWNALPADERERYSSLVQRVVDRAAATVVERQPDQAASYAEQLLRVRSKALSVLERMLDLLPAEDPDSLSRMKEVGKVLRDLHEMTAASAPASGSSAAAEEFYRQLKAPATINIQNNYYGKRADDDSDPGDQPGRIR